jgi:hypothetical protein
MRASCRTMSRAFVFAVVGIVGVSRGAAIVDYNFVSNTNVPASDAGYSQAATTLAPNVSSTPIKGDTGGGGSGGAGVGTGGGTNGTGLTVDYTVTAATSGYAETNEAQSVSSACYWNFVVTPLNGAAMNISDISVSGARGGGSTPRGFYIESSIDNPNNTWGTKDIFGIGSEQSQRDTAGTYPAPTTYNASNYTSFEPGGANSVFLGSGSLNLSGNSAYQNVMTPIEFRIYVIAPASGNSIDFTDFSVNGTVTGAPEPACIGLIGLGSLGLLCRHRRASF